MLSLSIPVLTSQQVATDDKVISLIYSDDCIPSAMKKLKLDVEMGEKLSDLHINAAQKILKIQFPAINGL